MVAANVGKLDGIAYSVDVDGDGGSVKSVLPFVDQALYCINQTILRHGVKEANQVIVDGIQVDVIGRWR